MRFLVVSIATLVVASTFARPAFGQVILLTGPLAGAPAGNLLWRAHRLELAAVAGGSLGSGDRASLLWGAEAFYYPWDRLGAGLWGSGASPVARSGHTSMDAIVSPELAMVPFAGKVHHSFSDVLLQYDLHVIAGAARVFGTRDGSADSKWAAVAGVGFRGFNSGSFANSLDYRLLLGDPVRQMLVVTLEWWPLARHWSDE